MGELRRTGEAESTAQLATPVRGEAFGVPRGERVARTGVGRTLRTAVAMAVFITALVAPLVLLNGGEPDGIAAAFLGALLVAVPFAWFIERLQTEETG